MVQKASRESASIVLLGSFNPAIFQPSWLALKDLVPRSTAENASPGLITPQVSQFEITGMKVTVLHERFAIGVDEVQDQVRMRDLVLGIFSILAETPITRMGLNWTFEFKLPSEEKWHAMGDLLAPKDLWRDLVPGRPGLKTLTIQGQRPTRESPGVVNVRIEPRAGNGVFFEVNNDFILPDGQAKSGVDYFIDSVKRDWDEVRSKSTSLVHTLLERAGVYA